MVDNNLGFQLRVNVLSKKEKATWGKCTPAKGDAQKPKGPFHRSTGGSQSFLETTMASSVKWRLSIIVSPLYPRVLYPWKQKYTNHGLKIFGEKNPDSFKKQNLSFLMI